MKQRIRVLRKFTSLQQKLSFNTAGEEEFISTESFFDEHGNLTEEHRNEDGETSPEKHVYVYDQNGKLLKHELHVIDENINETMVYTRDDKGRVISEQKLYGDDEGEKTVYEYAEHDKPVKITRYDADGELESDEILIYDSGNLLTEHQLFSPGKKPVEKTVITYNDQKLPTEKKVFDGSGKEIRSMVITYTADGDVERITERNENGKITSDVLSVYDERRNVVERRIRDFQSRTLKFEFDENNNCISEETFDEHGNLLRKNTYEFDETNRVTAETALYVDTMRGGNFNNSRSRFEYEFYA